MANRLDNKIALITGGTTGIGEATAKLFQAEGATVIVTGSNPATLEAARANLPGIEVIASNQSDPAAAKALVEQVKASHGRIDVLFVNAGIGRFEPVEAVDQASYDTQFNTNVRGVYFTMQHAAPLIPQGGSILITGSVSGVQGMSGASVYAATKAAVRSFTRSFAAELAPRGIRVNIISPGPIETPIMGKTGLSAEQVQGFLAGMKARVPLGRIGHSDEVAKAALYLATDATFTTGAELFVDGGLANI